MRRSGSYALSSSKTNLFATALGGYLDAMSDVFQAEALPVLWQANGLPLALMPHVSHGDVEHVDMKELSEAIKNMAQAGFDVSRFRSAGADEDGLAGAGSRGPRIVPWVALAPGRFRAWPAPRPRLRVVKAAPNPYDAYAPLYLEQEHAKLLAALANPLDYGMSLVHQAKLKQVEQAMQAQGLPVPGAAIPPATPPPINSVAQWEKLMDLAQAAAPKMQQALTERL